MHDARETPSDSAVWRRILKIACVTTPLWLLTVLMFASAAYLDSGETPRDLGVLLTVYALGFLPWIIAAPAVVWTGMSQAHRKPGAGRMIVEVAALAAGVTMLVLANMAVVIAPFWGVTAEELFATNSFREWISDILIFAVAFVSGHALRGRDRPADGRQDLGGRTILVRSATRDDFVDISDIIAASAQGNYVALITEYGEFLHRTTLAKLKAQLDPHGFVQVHRSHLVRADAITSIKRGRKEVQSVLLRGGISVPVSPSGKQVLARILERRHAPA
ncbi:MAG: LytTR family DNA-binding domain-containing protein [Pseudomonadota bacterium]